MKSNYIKFFRNFLLFAVLLFVADRAIGRLLAHYFLKISSTEAARISYVVNKADEKMIVFGSSRANHHYVPTVFQDSLHLSCYNAGIDGECILYHDCVLKCLLKRGAPEVIVLDLNTDELSTWRNEEAYSKLSALLPYYRTHPEIDSVVNLKSRFEKYKVLSDTYRYNSLAFTIAINNLHKKKDTSINGYCPLYRQLSSADPGEAEVKGKTLDETKVSIFQEFISEAQAAGCRLYIFVSPTYEKMNSTPNTILAARKMCSDKHVPFYDFSQDPYFLAHPEFFQDASHLNNEGARLYSKIVYQKIRKT